MSKQPRKHQQEQEQGEQDNAELEAEHALDAGIGGLVGTQEQEQGEPMTQGEQLNALGAILTQQGEQDSPTQGEPTQDSPSVPQPSAADRALTAGLYLLALVDAARDAGTGVALPIADVEHAGNALSALGRSKQGEQQRSLLLAGMDSYAADRARADRDLLWIDAADHATSAVTRWLADHASTSSSPRTVDPVQHAADVLATCQVMTAMTLAALSTDEQRGQVFALIEAGQVTADVSVLGVRGKPRTAGSTSTSPRTAGTGTKRPAGTIAAGIVSYLGEHAADGHAVKLGVIAQGIDASPGAVRRALDAGTVPGVTMDAVTHAGDTAPVRSAWLTAPATQGALAPTQPQEQDA